MVAERGRKIQDLQGKVEGKNRDVLDLVQVRALPVYLGSPI